jgi:ABC-type lipoprotein export system ATPase subunit
MTAQPLLLDGVSRSVLDSGQEKRTLAKLDRVFAPGQFHVVNGPSGAGKTTLLSLLALAVPPSRGMLHWGPLNLTQLKPQAAANWRRANLGMIFQTSRLVSVMTALENVCFGGAIRGKRVEPEAHRLLEGFGLGAKKGSVSRSPRRWPARPACCWPMNRPPALTPPTPPSWPKR